MLYDDNGIEVTKNPRGYYIEDEDGDEVRIPVGDAVNISRLILVEEGQAADTVLASQVSFNEGLFRLASAHGKEVEFRYAKGSGSVIETRVLKPEAIKQVGGHLTFIGYDPDRDAPRAYRLDRVKGEVTVR